MGIALKQIMEIIFWIVILIMSVVIHEVSHGYVAYLQGDPTAYYAGRLTLNPFKHLDFIGSFIVPVVTSFAGFPFGWAKPVPFNPYNLKNQRWGEFLIAIAGPLSNITIAIIFGLILRIANFNVPQAFFELSLVVVIVNIVLAVFNLIPIPPLDGSKILFNILPSRFLEYRVILEQYSVILLIVLIIILRNTVFFGSIIGTIFQLITGIPPAAIGL